MKRSTGLTSVISNLERMPGAGNDWHKRPDDWWGLRSSDSNYTQTTFGSSGDIPLTGNWDGDSYADIAVFRPSTGYWYVQGSTAGSMQLGWGLSTELVA